MAEHDSICLEAEMSSLTADLDAINETRIAELESSMSKVQCNVQDINAKLDMLVNSALAQQQSRKDDNLVRASDSQPVRPSGDHLARSGHNLTEQAGNGFIPDNMAMELDSGPASSAGRDSSGTNPDEQDAMQLIRRSKATKRRAPASRLPWRTTYRSVRGNASIEIISRLPCGNGAFDRRIVSHWSFPR